MNWDDPAERLTLIEQIVPKEYNRRVQEHMDKSVVSRVGGHSIRPVNTRFGRLFQVGSTGTAYNTQAAAEKYAAEHPV